VRRGERGFAAGVSGSCSATQRAAPRLRAGPGRSPPGLLPHGAGRRPAGGDPPRRESGWAVSCFPKSVCCQGERLSFTASMVKVCLEFGVDGQGGAEVWWDSRWFEITKPRTSAATPASPVEVWVSSLNSASSSFCGKLQAALRFGYLDCVASSLPDFHFATGTLPGFHPIIHSKLCVSVCPIHLLVTALLD